MDALGRILKQHHLRLTDSRTEVFQALMNSEVPLTIAEITKACPHTNRTSVYRILETFHRLHIINTIHVGWKLHYELAEPFMPHHHHLYCTRCKNAIPLETPELEQLISYISRQHHFQVQHHHFELEGICQRCQASDRTDKRL
ncbi:MAG: transcriptional repressor [Candidatus Saccharibacteria bacterium]|nr:transcriptional repressor [Candidatus Saccharibacteria bacterium]